MKGFFSRTQSKPPPKKSFYTMAQEKAKQVEEMAKKNALAARERLKTEATKGMNNALAAGERLKTEGEGALKHMGEGVNNAKKKMKALNFTEPNGNVEAYVAGVKEEIVGMKEEIVDVNARLAALEKTHLVVDDQGGGLRKRRKSKKHGKSKKLGKSKKRRKGRKSKKRRKGRKSRKRR